MKPAEFFTVPDDISESDLFKKMIAISVILHIMIFMGLVLKAYIIPNESLVLDAAIRVDMVDLPDKRTDTAPLPTQPKHDEKAEPAKPLEKDTAKPKPEPVVLNKNPKIKEKALSRIRKIQREEDERKRLAQMEKEVQEEEANERRERAKEALIKGNMISPGTALHGLQKAEFNEYLVQVRNQVKEHWNLPEWLQDEKLKVRVTVFIDDHGVIMKRFLKQSSGDVRFDDYAIKAVDDASPLPPPPKKFVDLVRVDGLVVELTP